MSRQIIKEDTTGFMRSLCLKQGYVPTLCTMDGFMIMAFINGGDDPCEGCDENRSVCSGRPSRKEQK